MSIKSKFMITHINIRSNGIVDLVMDVVITVLTSTTIMISTTRNEITRTYVSLGAFVDVGVNVFITTFRETGHV